MRICELPVPDSKYHSDILSIYQSCLSEVHWKN